MIGKDFLVTAGGLSCFDQYIPIEASWERLEALSTIVNMQIKAILD